MIRKTLIVLLCIFMHFGVACGRKDSESPRVISTFPLNGSQGVDPSLTEISVTFNEEMTDQSWSWVYEDKNK